MENVIIGQIISIEPHPNAKKLRVVSVKIDQDKDPVIIVCSASNINQGDLVPVVLPGGTVNSPDGGKIEVKEIALRGVVSYGMMCSPLEINLGENHTEIFILPNKFKKHLGESLEKLIDQLSEIRQLSSQEKFDLITANCEEILTPKDLMELIKSNTPLSHYIGFEISGMVHLGTGLISMGKIADFLNAGVNCKIFLADFHSYLNNKLGGKWDDIRKATESYFKQGLVASLKCHNVDPNSVEFIMGKNLYENNLIHWETFMEIGKHITLARNLRSVSIMGKKQGEAVDMATLFYPPLQVADIFTMRVNLAHAGMDQRKAHVIARQVAKKLTINPLKNNRGELIAPVAIHHNLIAGLDGPKNKSSSTGKDVVDLKMSKSKPDSAIFIHDSPEEIRQKIKKAYCPPAEIEFNPIINWVQFLIFWGKKTGKFIVKRPRKFGGNKEYNKFSEVVKDYQSENLHPQDLKEAVALWLIDRLAPAREHFSKGEAKKGLEFIRKITSV